MKRTLCIGAVALVAAAAGALALHAAGQPPGHTPPFAHDDTCPLAAMFHAHMRQLHEDLKLTDAQDKAIHGVLRARQGELAAAALPVVKAHRAILNQTLADTADE